MSERRVSLGIGKRGTESLSLDVGFRPSIVYLARDVATLGESLVRRLLLVAGVTSKWRARIPAGGERRVHLAAPGTRGERLVSGIGKTKAKSYQSLGFRRDLAAATLARRNPAISGTLTSATRRSPPIRARTPAHDTPKPRPAGRFLEARRAARGARDAPRQHEGPGTAQEVARIAGGLRRVPERSPVLRGRAGRQF